MSAALWISDSGASTAEIERGVVAAMALLAARGVSAELAHAAALAEAADESADPAAADAWRAAERAALDACCAGWQRIPDSAVLTLG